MLDELLYTDRKLVDNWDKMASLSLAEDWPYFSRHRGRMEDMFGVPSEVVMSLAPEILAQIKDAGPQCSLDFDYQDKTDWAWGPTRVSRASLEGLFKMGQLGVNHRVNNRRYFDLIERLLPEDLLQTADPNQSLEEYQAWHILRRIRGIGLAHPNAGEQWGGMIGIKSPRRKIILEQLVQQDLILEIEVEELAGEVFYMQTKDLDLLEEVNKSRASPRAAFIAPLDNLLWDRKSLTRLFDFNYMWEVYKPEAKREYGYYVLPVLYGDRLIGRIDPSFDKSSRLLTINNWWWEDDFQPDERSNKALQQCLERFLALLGIRGHSILQNIIEERGVGLAG